MKIIRLKNYPIFQQLQLEEALLRLSTEDICLINEGSAPAIVMGISGKMEELIDAEKLEKTTLPVIRRFSGGGTVVVDEETIFISFLCQSASHSFSPYPEPIMRWTEGIYKEALGLPHFALRENDYVIGERKVGGNAQYLRKGRWLHHSTFLWDYKKEHMDLLLHPKKTPKYRSERSHEAFVTKLKSYVATKEEFLERLVSLLGGETVSFDELFPILEKPHRQSTSYVRVVGADESTQSLTGNFASHLGN